MSLGANRSGAVKWCGRLVTLLRVLVVLAAWHSVLAPFGIVQLPADDVTLTIAPSGNSGDLDQSGDTVDVADSDCSCATALLFAAVLQPGYTCNCSTTFNATLLPSSCPGTLPPLSEPPRISPSVYPNPADA